MILDAIIGFLASLFSILAQGVSLVCIPLVNLIAAGIEAFVGIFVSGFSLGRIDRQKKGASPTVSTAGGIVVLLIIVGLLVWFVAVPKVMNREVNLVAEDGYSLPFAALIVQTKDGEQHERTDSAGNISIPRFSTISVTIKDPRYLEETWEKSEIKSELVVGRTILGSGLDSLTEKLLKPAQKP